ncbi:hypothetical protein BJX64DRAFT_293500 [Aspergillus heterothallicus]
MPRPSNHKPLDCYKILDISRDANIRDINSAYKSLALKNHPDKTGDDDDAILKFQRIQQAVEILRDPAAREAHDRQLPSPLTADEEILNSPGYHGWVATGLHARHITRSARYMYSYRNSVHMDPHSKESQEEVQRCAQALKEEEMERREHARQEEDMRELKRNIEKMARSWKEMQAALDSEIENEKPGAGPGAYPSDSSDSHHIEEEEEEDHVEAEWWKGAKPKGIDDFQSERDSTTGSGLTGGYEEDADIKVDSDDEFKLGNIADVGRWSHLADISADVENKLEYDFGLDSDDGQAAEEIENTADISEFHVDSVPCSEKSSGDSAFKDESILNLERRLENHNELDDKVIVAEAEAKAEIQSEGSTYVNSVTTGLAFFDTSSPEKLTTDYRTASAGSPPDLAPSPYMMRVGLGYPDLEPQVDADKSFVTQTEYGSDSSVYYEFSEPASPTPKGIDDRNSNIAPTLRTYDFKFNPTNVYPYLRPFIPYFTAKLAHKDGRYTRDDFLVELRGILMETYCGWLETVRAAIPGAESLEATLDPVPQDCLHLGYWDKRFGRNECEECHLWKPIYSLMCPGCGISKCVGCKFEDANNKYI